MEKDPRKLSISSTRVVFLLILSFLFLDFFCGNIIPFDQCKSTILPSSTSLILQHGEDIFKNGRDSILRNYFHQPRDQQWHSSTRARVLEISSFKSSDWWVILNYLVPANSSRFNFCAKCVRCVQFFRKTFKKLNWYT